MRRSKPMAGGRMRMTSETTHTAVIYCRVSSAKQVSEGHGLGSQETRCREYAGHKGHDVSDVFRDDVTGGITARPGMQAMLAHLRGHRARGTVVIIDDISRLARGLEAHLKLRTDISKAGGRLESPSIEFGEDSDSQLVENLLASVSQHQRQKNGEQTRNRMRARALGGYWVFRAPLGYRFERVPGHGKMLVGDEPAATIIAEALEGYATGRFESQIAVKRFLDHVPDYPKDRTGAVHLERVKELLTRPIYAGYINIPEWGIHLQPGKHEALVSFVTYQAIQRRLHAGAKAPYRADINTDFPLRGFVACASCGQSMTACWSTGRHQKYPYYLCDTKGCGEYRKSVRKETLEGEFETLLYRLTPERGVIQLADVVFRDSWDRHTDSAQSNTQAMKAERASLMHKTDQLMDRILSADSETLITAYEQKIRNLEEQKAALTEKITQCGRPLADFDTIYRTALTFLGNPQKLWASNRLEDKRIVPKLAFSTPLTYARNEGYRTAETTLPFKVLEEFRNQRSGMVRLAGLEPPLPCGKQILSLFPYSTHICAETRCCTINSVKTIGY